MAKSNDWINFRPFDIWEVFHPLERYGIDHSERKEGKNILLR